jgi:lipoprotein-anchoring transpeptidase ErfK/SrfK
MTQAVTLGYRVTGLGAGRGNGVFGVRGAGKQAAGQELERPLGKPQSEGAGPGGDPPRGGSGGGNGRGSGQNRRNRLILAGALAVAVVIAGTTYAVLRAGSSYTGPDLTLPDVHVLRLDSVTPTTGSTDVNGAGPIIVQFNGPIKDGTTNPVIQPAVVGTWTYSGDSAIFAPATAFAPSTRYTVSVPAGVQARGGAKLASTTTVHFTTGAYSQLRLSQLLSQLGYLPFTWSPASNPAARAEALNGGGVAQSEAAMAFNPPAGTFAFQSGYPTALAAMWNPDQANVLLKGAVMAFQHDHGMLPNADTGPKLWAALFKAASDGSRNASGYTYAVASKTLPESLTIWHNGHQVFHALANTGIPVSPTADGTFPVYQKYAFQIMRGTNPDGSSYADPVSFVSYFNGGDAVHYFPRPGYGYQQSLGCVELPYNAAKAAYPYLTYGSLVTVAN